MNNNKVVMGMRWVGILILVSMVLIFHSSFALAHPGGTDSYGCHHCWTNCENWGLKYGEYHCHDGSGGSSYNINKDENNDFDINQYIDDLERETNQQHRNFLEKVLDWFHMDIGGILSWVVIICLFSIMIASNKK